MKNYPTILVYSRKSPEDFRRSSTAHKADIVIFCDLGYCRVVKNRYGNIEEMPGRGFCKMEKLPGYLQSLNNLYAPRAVDLSPEVPATPEPLEYEDIVRPALIQGGDERYWVGSWVCISSNYWGRSTEEWHKEVRFRRPVKKELPAPLVPIAEPLPELEKEIIRQEVFMDEVPPALPVAEALGYGCKEGKEHKWQPMGRFGQNRGCGRCGCVEMGPPINQRIPAPPSVVDGRPEQIVAAANRLREYIITDSDNLRLNRVFPALERIIKLAKELDRAMNQPRS